MGPNVGLPARLLLGGTFFLYFAGTSLLYFWGPWTYPMSGSVHPLILFLAAVHISFAAGYLIGIVGNPRPAHVRVRIDTVVLAAVLVELALLFPTSALNTGHWIPNPFAAARDLGAAYSSSLTVRGYRTPYVNYVRMLAAPLLAAATPLAVFFWRDLRPLTRVLFAASTLGTFALFIAMGANAGIGHWIALFPWFVLAAHFSGRRQISRSGWMLAGIILTLSVALLAIVFTGSMVQRRGSYVAAGYLPGVGAYIGPVATPRINPSGQLESPYAERSAARIGMDGIAVYLTQGYYAVYLSMQEPFVPCYGVGNSVFLQRQVARIAKRDDLLECPYPFRLEKRGWSPERYWATIYPWIASDATFFGTVVVVGLIGWLAGRVWLDVLGSNPWAIALLGQVLLMLYYFPAHNKIMHSGEGVFGFAVLLGGWLFTRASVSGWQRAP